MKRIIYLIMSVAAVLGLGLAAATAASASAKTPAHLAAAGESTLWDGQSLSGGQSLVDGSYTLAMQTDGNFVIYDHGSAIWAAGTQGKGRPAYRLAVQPDGNLVIYGSSDNDVSLPGYGVCHANSACIAHGPPEQGARVRHTL